MGGQLIEVGDAYPHNVFEVLTPRWTLWYERHIGWIPYRKYCNQRIRLKERGRKLSHLPAHFTGRYEGSRFEKIAPVEELTNMTETSYKEEA